MIKKRFIVCLTAIICLSVSSLDVWGRSIEDTRRQQTEVAGRIRERRRQIYNNRAQINVANAELHALEYEMALVVERLEGIMEELEIIQEDLDQAEIDLAEATEVRDRQFEAFVQRSRSIYMHGWTGYIDAILGAESFTDLLNRIDHVNRIIEFDRNLVQELQRTEERISAIVVNMQRQRDDLAVMEVMAQNQIRMHDEAMEEKAALITSLEDNAAELNRMQREDEAAEAAFQRAIREHEAQLARERAEAAARAAANRQPPPNQPAAISPDGNALTWPLAPGRSISSGYGNRRDPFTGRTSFHTGVDVPAPLGTNIFAAADGTVIFSGWQGGFGNTVIIDHGNGMQTLYAHASTLLVGRGARVTRGEVIARVGSTGRSTGNHLHFEVRINGAHTNPMNFTRVR